MPRRMPLLSPWTRRRLLYSRPLPAFTTPRSSLALAAKEPLLQVTQFALELLNLCLEGLFTGDRPLICVFQ